MILNRGLVLRSLRRNSLALLVGLFLSALAMNVLVPVVSADGTRTWEQSKFEDLTKGTATGIAIRSSGGVELAPSFKLFYATPSTYIWAVAADESGNVYAATGSPARVYRITPDGQATIIFEPQELQVQTLEVGPHGVIYAATAPDGKVYKIESKPQEKGAATKGSKSSEKDAQKGAPKDSAKPALDPSWTSAEYFAPGTKYIWDLVLDKAGNLYVATGDHGEIYKVTPKGDHSLFFKSDETHIRVLALDREGNIYAAGVGEKRAGTSTSPSASSSSALSMGSSAVDSSGSPTPGMTLTLTPSTSHVGSFPFPGGSSNGGSDVYRIAADGSPSRIWTSHEDIVYALAFDSHDKLLAGTGNRGHVFTIDGQDDFSDLLKAPASQVTGFAKAPGGGLYAVSSNLGKIFLLGPGPESEGTYESDVFDAKVFSRWGRAEFRGAGNVELLARSGNVDNPDRNWSPWKQVNLAQESEMAVPPARYAQWKAVLHAGSVKPAVNIITLNYLPKNVAPEIEDVLVQMAVRYQPLAKSTGLSLGTDVSGSTGSHFESPVPSTHDRDSIGVKWNAHDDNDDQLVYSVYYRGDGEPRWLLLKDNLTDKAYSFDASLLPDGGYTVKVVASDAPSHSPGEALSATKESRRFEVDTTPPRVEKLTASVEGTQIHVRFRAEDGFSTIKRAEFSVDAGDWKYVEPIGQLADAKIEDYDFKADVDAGKDAVSEHVVVIRVYDKYENMGAAKTLLKGK